MNESLGINKHINLFQSNDLSRIPNEEIVRFFQNHPEIEDVFNYGLSLHDNWYEEKIRRYIGTTFEEILKHSGFTDDLDDIKPYGDVESASSVSRFIIYGDEVESLKQSLEEAIGNCEWFESYKREEWEEDVQTLRSNYKQFMTNWINGENKTEFVFDVRQ